MSTDITGQLGPVQPHVADAAQLLADKFGLTTMSGYRASNSRDPNGHPKGLAIDIPATRTVGDALASYVTANAPALGVKYVIWQQRIWRPDKPTWTPMETRTGAGDQNHLRHVHVSFTEAPPEASLSDRLRANVAGAWEAVTGAVGGAADAVGGAAADLNPFARWQQDALGLGVKIAAVIAGLGLVVLGTNRLVGPAVGGAIDKTMEALT